jgi:RNA 2',3'-cyclic 3'-phosphodiesterase
MAAIRSFIALPSSPELKRTIQDIQARLIEERADVKWDTPDKLHLTLKFLGNMEPGQLTAVAESLAIAASATHAFPLTYGSVGAFPDLVHPKVIWVGAEASIALTSLLQLVEQACGQLGIPKETRTFHPHITLGRVKGSTNLARLTAKLKSITFDPIVTGCSAILLIKSDLHPTGSVYTTLNSFPLNA